MALITEQRTRPAEEWTATAGRICDLCGVEVRSGDNESWTHDIYAVNDTIVTMKEGSKYPEGTNFRQTSVDICPACFKTKLIPWLESQGAKVRTEEVNF